MEWPEGVEEGGGVREGRRTAGEVWSGETIGDETAGVTWVKETAALGLVSGEGTFAEVAIRRMSEGQAGSFTKVFREV